MSTALSHGPLKLAALIYFLLLINLTTGQVGTHSPRVSQWESTARLKLDDSGVVVFSCKKANRSIRRVTLSASSEQLLADRVKWAHSGASHIRFSQMVVTEPLVEFVATLKDVNQLEFAETETSVSGRAIRPLASMTWLSALKVDNTEKFESSEWEFLKSLSELTELELGPGLAFGGPDSSKAALPLESLPKLQYIGMSDPSIATLEAIGRIHELRSVSLSSIHIRMGRIVEALLNHPHLTDLGLLTSTLSASDVTHLTRLKEITSLSIGGDECGSIAPIRDFRKLSTLELNFRRFSDLDSLVAVRKIETLEHLSIFLLAEPDNHSELEQLTLAELQLWWKSKANANRMNEKGKGVGYRYW